MTDSELAGKVVVIGVGGGIAAYKSVEIVRLLVSQGAHVVPILTDAAHKFVGELTFSALASEPVVTSLWSGDDPIPHTSLGQKADVLLLAPATADLLGRVAHGLADDLVTNVALATRAPLVLAPAMHAEMWDNPAVVSNVEVLRSRKAVFVGPLRGQLARGDVGFGRMASPHQIVEVVRRVVSSAAKRPWSSQMQDSSSAETSFIGAESSLIGKTVLVSAGGTRENIDDVRYLGNRSSGRQGHALAQEALRRGANVVLVTASALPEPKGSEVIRAQSAAQMQAGLMANADRADLIIMAAAVSDFRPVSVINGKLSRAHGCVELRLEPTEDILALLSAHKRHGQVIVGFAAEVGELEKRAAEKLWSKGADLIVANDVSQPGIGFDSDDNSVVVVGKEGVVSRIGKAPKTEIAALVLDAATALLKI